MSRDRIFTVVSHLVNTLTEISIADIVDAHDNTPSEKMPKGQYCSIWMRTPVPYGTPGISNNSIPDDDSHVLQEITQSKRMKVTVSFYRNFDVYEKAEKFLGCYELFPIKQYLRENDIGLSRQIEGPTPGQAVLNGKSEQRAYLTLELFYQDITTVKVNKIKHVSVQVNVNGTTIDMDVSNDNKPLRGHE